MVLVHRDADAVAKAAADALVTHVLEAQARRGVASLVLTGGGLGIATLAALAAAGQDRVDWSAVDLWWGDERFLPEGDPDRNDTQASPVFLDLVGADPSRVHPVAGPDGAAGDDPEAAAARYAAELTQAAGPGRAVPVFDVVLLGMGPEGHVASIFPDSPAARADGIAVAVRDCPKPPPTRVSMTFPTLSAGREVWFLVAGAAKAEAVARALSGATPQEVPSAGPHGRELTRWLIDEEAAAQLPPDVRRKTAG